VDFSREPEALTCLVVGERGCGPRPTSKQRKNCAAPKSQVQSQNVVALPSPRSACVTQEDLLELTWLRRRFEERLEEWRAKRDEVLQALKAGAEVEEGVLTAKIKEDVEVR